MSSILGDIDDALALLDKALESTDGGVQAYEAPKENKKARKSAKHENEEQKTGKFLRKIPYYNLEKMKT